MTCVVAATLVAGLAPAGAEEATTRLAPPGAENATTPSSRPAAPKPAPPPAPVTPKTGFVPGKSTEDVSKRSAQSKTFRNPDGSHTAQISGDVQHYWTGSGWADISNRLVADPAGGYRNQANSFTARFRSSDVRVETPQGAITLNPAGDTLGAPVVDAAAETVTYPDVWPGVDVRYRVQSTGVKEELVLRRRPSMSQFPFQVGGTSLSSHADGSLAMSGTFAGKWKVSPPVVFDKDGNTVADAAPRFSVSGQKVTLAVDGTWLAGLGDADFPVVLDPSIWSVGSYQSRSFKRNPYDDGYYTCDVPCQPNVGIHDTSPGWQPWRTVQYFPYENLYGKQILKGQLIYQVLQGDSTTAGKVMKVYGDDVNGQWGGINNFTNLGAPIITNGWAVNDSFIWDENYGGPLGAYYQDIINRRLPFMAIKLLGDETGGYSYKRFYWFTLQLTYNDPPDRPYYIAPPANATLNYPDPWLVANNDDPNDDNVALRFRLYREADGAYMGGKDGGFTCDGCQDYWYPGPLANGRYFWDEWAWDGRLDSPIVRNYFTIAVPPSAPQNVVATPDDGGSATVTWTPPASTGGSTIDQYAVNVFYASNGAWTGQQVIVCGTCTSATVTGLALDTGYYFGAYAHTSAGYGNPGISNTISVPNVPPVGALDQTGGSRFAGWVHDPNNPAQPLTVRIYLDGAPPPTPTATVTANVSRPNANPPASDGFEWIVPSQYRDGKDHRVRVEAVDSTSGVPVTLTAPTLSFANLAESWTGANTSPWDTSRWITSVGVGGGVSSAVNIKSNQGQLYVKGGDAMAIAQNPTGTIAPMRDGEATFTYTMDSRTASSTFRTIMRGSGAWPLNSGYRLNVTSDTSIITVERVSGGTASTLASFSYTKNISAQRVRFRVEGARIRVKMWLAGTAEPDPWQVDVTDTSPLTGSGVLQFHHSVVKGSRSVLIDDLAVARFPAAVREPNPTSAPRNSVSRYINTGPGTDFSALGGQAGGDVKNPCCYDPFIILNFDYQTPAKASPATGAEGYGGADFSEQNVVDSAVNFINGYYGAIPGRDLVLAVGTTNDFYYDNRESDANEKGKAWARITNRIWDQVKTAHPDMSVVGAQDFEAGSFRNGRWNFGGPAPNGPTKARAWVAGWGGETNTNGLGYIDYGSADGCPTSGATKTPAKCGLDWTQDDYWYISAGTNYSAGTLPQTYNIKTSDPKDTPGQPEGWREVSIYGYKMTRELAARFPGESFPRGDINFFGVLTQIGACETRDCDRDPVKGTVTPPDQAWQNMRATLDADPITRGEGLGYATDITWRPGT
jgi:hypothetical protein